MVEPTMRRSEGKALTNVKTWDDSSSENDPPSTRDHHSPSRSSHKCLMARGKTSIPSSSDDSSSDDGEGEGNPSLDEFAESVKFLRMYALNKRLDLKP
jgi:hypothetical protein